MAIVGSYIAERFEAKNKAAASEQLDAAIAVSGLNAQHQVLNGTVYDSVLETADKLGADLIIIDAHQPKLRDYQLRANAAKVVRHSKQSVLVVRSAG
jgi:nucleotide-binding universal stress UspA family protein